MTVRAFHFVSAATALLLTTAVCSFSLPAQAQDASGFRLEALNGICSDVRAANVSRYEAKIAEAAGVRPDDTPAQRRARIAALFSQFMPHCDGFNVRQGNILKYAVSQNASSFIYAAIHTWGVDLNQVDASDGRTVLDYVNAGIARNVGSIRDRLIGYGDELVRGGAKTRAQAEAEGRTYPGIPSIAEIEAQARPQQ
ncbi:hypothetical protein [Brevundimonas sp.]|uniref:hypothetical protein n=1 Tax=Brevundimonas sp. TaxID=1871086 RepID=UPI002621468C|nr:hypothetical protein [Brevundimonas sp.]